MNGIHRGVKWSNEARAGEFQVKAWKVVVGPGGKRTRVDWEFSPELEPSRKDIHEMLEILRLDRHPVIGEIVRGQGYET